MLLSSLIAVSADEVLPFKDVKSSAWYYSSVSTVYAEGIMEGKGEGKFAPKASMTRAELVTVLCRLSTDAYEGKGEALTFKDTKKSVWYADFVAWAVECGIVLGYEDNTFRPNAPVLRCELAKMFVGFLEYMNTPMEGVPHVESFADSASFPKWAADYIETLRRTGIMGGDTAGNFNPRANASRAEIATVITRLLPMLRAKAPIYVVENAVSNYVFVYDDSVPDIVEAVTDLQYRLKVHLKIKARFVPASKAETSYGHEIVIGNVRHSAKLVYDTLDPTGDFAVTYSGDDIVAVTNDPIFYPYVFAVIEKSIVDKYADGKLRLFENFGMRYKDSDISELNYAEYLAHTDSVIWNYMDGLFSRESYKASDGTELLYRLYVPSDYDSEKTYPVLVFLHGAGERGSDNAAQLSNMITTMIRHDGSPLTDAIVICPQCPESNQWVDTPWANGSYSIDTVKRSNELTAVVELLGVIGGSYSTDADRYYAMGLSMGGFGTWDLIMRSTDIFAAAVPICGGADPEMAEELCNFPIYTVHGTADSIVPISGTREMVEALKDKNSTKLIYEELEGYEHNVWDYVAGKKEILDWLFAQRLSDRAE